MYEIAYEIGITRGNAFGICETTFEQFSTIFNFLKIIQSPDQEWYSNLVFYFFPLYFF